jgi:hypothetical protein
MICCAAAAFCWQGGLRAEEARTYYFQMICGSDRELPLKGDFKAVGPKLRNQLEAKFRWKNWAEVSRGKCIVATNMTASIRLPEQREMQLHLINPKTLEARLYRGKDLVRTTRENANAESVIMGGDQGKDESWFIIIRRDKPSSIDTAQK